MAQNFNIAADGSLTATIALPSSLVDTDLSTALFAITVAERVNKREDLAPIISGALSRPDDTVAISPLCCPGPQAGQYTILDTARGRARCDPMRSASRAPACIR